MTETFDKKRMRINRNGWHGVFPPAALGVDSLVGDGNSMLPTAKTAHA